MGDVPLISTFHAILGSQSSKGYQVGGNEIAGDTKLYLLERSLK
jgi:hypothetical protein